MWKAAISCYLVQKQQRKPLIPRQRSATASDTKNALVFVRSRRLLYTRKIINPFPIIVRMDRNQPRTQNHASVLVYVKITFDSVIGAQKCRTICSWVINLGAGCKIWHILGQKDAKKLALWKVEGAWLTLVPWLYFIKF